VFRNPYPHVCVGPNPDYYEPDTFEMFRGGSRFVRVPVIDYEADPLFKEKPCPKQNESLGGPFPTISKLESWEKSKYRKDRFQKYALHFGVS